jgi:hypothetical protein
MAALPPRSATRLSWLGTRLSGRFGRFVGLARLSLLGASIGMLPGCLVDDPPPLITQQKTAPRLDYSKVEPGLDQLLVLNSGDFVRFKIPVISEDAGDPLLASLLFDFTPGSNKVPEFVSVPLPASTLDDTKRIATLPLVLRSDIKPGCHRYTLRITHQSNLVDGLAYQVINEADMAEAFWFANINVAPENAGTLVNCPSGGSN